jgi:hypothetical protein
MDQIQAREWLRLKRDEVENTKAEIDRLNETGDQLGALALLQKFCTIVDPAEAYAIALIAEGQELQN